MFPLLEEVRNAAATASKEILDAELSIHEGKKIKMMVHHSRNSIAKQWDETQVVALSGVTRIFKVHFSHLVILPTFNQDWNKLLECFEYFALSPSSEVSVAAVSALNEVVVSKLSNPLFARPYWVAVSQTWEKLVESMCKSDVNVTEKSLIALSNSLSELYQKFRSQFDVDDINRLLRIIHHLGLHPTSYTNQSEGEKDLSSLQKAVLKLLKQMPPVEEEIFPQLIQQLLNFICHAIGYQIPRNEKPEGPLPSSSSSSSLSSPSPSSLLPSSSSSSSLSPSPPSAPFVSPLPSLSLQSRTLR
eukprot:TRINITY_DN5113_c1_g1_i1.p1 TRINITY_DN5113_c1_g1~~TRINITY_DN5113_c1_g1_i1.p1  ORF type:complete len:302 (+),score=107.79 TRINITY_DN5113_c1_g1_i1:115-1020(+)